MTALCKRCLKLYFRDKGAVFFSLLAVFIVFGLYVLFLGDVYTDSLSEIPGAGLLIDCWTMAGMIAVASLNTAMGALDTMVQDRETGVRRDFSVTPMKRSSILGGYVGSTFLIGVIMSLITTVLAAFYLLIRGLDGAAIFTAGRLARIFAILLVTTLSNTAMLLLLSCLFSSGKAFSAAGTVVGTLSGFLTGVYLPIGQLPQGVQTLIKLFPTAHGAALLRQELMDYQYGISLAGMPEAVRTELDQILGVRFWLGDHVLPQWGYWGYLLLAGVVFLLCCLPFVARRER